jgi:hypothetical protein
VCSNDLLAVKEDATMKKLAIVTVSLLALLVLSSTAYGQETRHFEAELTGAQEVPPVITETEGEITVRFNRERTEAKFRLIVEDGVAVTMAHFHCAPAGFNGPIVAHLFGMIPGGFNVDGRLAKFTLTDANIVLTANCVPTIGRQIANVADLAQAMQEGLIYANVHTVANPGGEIRGQLKAD